MSKWRLLQDKTEKRNPNDREAVIGWIHVCSTDFKKLNMQLYWKIIFKDIICLKPGCLGGCHPIWPISFLRRRNLGPDAFREKHTWTRERFPSRRQGKASEKINPFQYLDFRPLTFRIARRHVSVWEVQAVVSCYGSIVRQTMCKVVPRVVVYISTMTQTVMLWTNIQLLINNSLLHAHGIPCIK